jgi:hypothetical protein
MVSHRRLMVLSKGMYLVLINSALVETLSMLKGTEPRNKGT